MGALKEYMESLPGRWATPVGSIGGPFKILRAYMDGQVLMIALETSGGEQSFKAHECVVIQEQ